jgi:hypothetical protein
MQIAVPNQSNKEQFLVLMLAFMKVSRLQLHSDKKQWANNVVVGLGRGTHSLLTNAAKGVSGVIYEPYIGVKKRGFKGGSMGFVKGIGGLFWLPVKGCFDFVAQPVCGFINTPTYLY